MRFRSVIGAVLGFCLILPLPTAAQTSSSRSGIQVPSAGILPDICHAEGLDLGLASHAGFFNAKTIRDVEEIQARALLLNSFPDSGIFRAEEMNSIKSHQQYRPIPTGLPEQFTRVDATDDDSKAIPTLISQKHPSPDRNADIYYRNRTEFSLDVGYHPLNIPFIYDFAVGDSYNRPPLNYTLVPIIASLRWQVTNVGWPWILRGNMDFTFSGSITAIPRGPETHYYAFMFGIRRNFVHPTWKAVPFFEQRGGAGMIDAKEPLGVLFAQGQNLTFTYSLGVGVRYNFDTKYALSAGVNYMHISNGYLSEPQFYNYGINVYGPMFGFEMRLGKPRHASQ